MDISLLVSSLVAILVYLILMYWMIIGINQMLKFILRDEKDSKIITVCLMLVCVIIALIRT